MLLGAAFGRTRLLRTRGFAGSALLARLWYHLAPPGAARSKHSRESHEGVPWGCNDRCEPAHELDPGHHTILAAPSAADVLEPVRYAPARQSAQPFERERRTRSVSRQALAPEIVAGFDADAGVHVEPITFDGECGLVGSLFRGPVPVVLRAVAWQRRNVAASHGDGSARVERRLGRLLVRARFKWGVIDVAALAKPGDRAARRPSDDRFQVRGGRRLCWMEDQLTPGIAREHAVEREQVEVNVEVQTSEALNEIYSSGASGVSNTIADGQMVGISN